MQSEALARLFWTLKFVELQSSCFKNLIFTGPNRDTNACRNFGAVFSDSGAVELGGSRCLLNPVMIQSQSHLQLQRCESNPRTGEKPQLSLKPQQIYKWSSLLPQFSLGFGRFICA